jgi:hypothetical protein
MGVYNPPIIPSIPPPKWHETNTFWGTTGGFLAFALTALGFGMSGHPMLAHLLFLASFPFACVALWCMCRAVFRRKILACSILSGVVAITLISVDHFATASPSHPAVFPVTAFWRNGLAEAVVQFKNTGPDPAYHNRTQIGFFATTEKSDNQKLDWDHLLPAISDNTVGPADGYNTSALTRLNAVDGGEEAVRTGNAVAYVYGLRKYKERPDSREDVGDRYCFEFDATRSQSFFGCPASAMQ